MAAPTCTNDEQPMLEHCETSSTCEWWTCPECGAVYDCERGIRRLRDGHVESIAD